MAGIRHHKDLTGVDLHVTKLHAATHLAGGTDPLGLGTASIADVPATGDASAIQVVLGNDSRLSNARTPSIHVHGEGDVTDLVTDLAAKIPKSLLTEQGDIIYASAVGTPAVLSHGIVGQVLQSGGHAANPSWLTLGTMAAAVATDYVPKSLFDAYSVLYADTDNTPARLTVGASTVVGRAAAGGIVALAKSDLLTLLNVADGANAYVHPNHSGDVTSVADGATTIVAGAVDLAMMADLAQDKIIGRATASTGVPEIITCTAAGRALLDDVAASNQRTTLGLGTMAVETATDYLAKAIVTAKGDVIAASANATPVHLAVGTDGQVLTADAASAAGVKWGNAGAGTVTAVTGTFPIVSSGGLTPAISLSDAGVTYAKMQNISATDKLLGRVTAGAGSPEEIACTAAGRALLDDANAVAQLATLGALPLAGGTMSGNIVMPDGGTIGQAAGPLVAFDDTNNYLEITGCKVGIGTTAPRGTEEIGYAIGDPTPLNSIVSGGFIIGNGGNVGAQLGVADAAGTYSTYIQARHLAAASTPFNLLLQPLGGNVGIGVMVPNANAILDVVSTTMAFMPPRMTTTQRDAIEAPAEGMVIFNTTTHVLNFYYTSWAAV